jgi:hypothetical protein
MFVGVCVFVRCKGAYLKGPGRDPYKIAVESVAKLARRYQISPGVLLLWYGHKWGDELTSTAKDDYKHMNVLQEIYPVIYIFIYGERERER